MNPILPVLAGAVLAALGFASGWQVNGWRLQAESAKVEQAAERAGKAATDAAVAAIKEIRPIYQTINKAVERETRIEPRYVDAGCSHTDGAWGVLDAAYQAAGGAPLGDRTGMPDPLAAR